MLSSITESTLKQYESSLKEWWAFAKGKNYDIHDADELKVIEFLTKRFNSGCKYGTLNSDRAAIALIAHERQIDNKLISRFMRGVFKKRPTRPKYVTTWDTDRVLLYIEAMPDTEKLDIKQLAEKTITLMILATAHRLQTMALINIDNIKISTTAIEIKVPDLIKTSKPGTFQPNLVLPFFKERKSVCVAKTLTQYLKITQALRGDTKNLFISTIKPHKVVGAQTLGHWVKAFLKKSGIDTDNFSAYSTKHAAVSKAKVRGVDIDTIRRTAGWSKNSSAFARFYNRPIQESNETFARKILS